MRGSECDRDLVQTMATCNLFGTTVRRVRERARAAKTLRNTSSHEGSGRHVCGSLSGSSTDPITLI